MRRSLILVSILLGAGSVALILASPMTASGRPVLCPWNASKCCGPPTHRFARPDVSQLCPAGVTISAAPDPVSAGQAVSVSGQVTSTVTVLAVTLWQRLPGSARFVSVGTTSPDPSGAYRFVRKGAGTSTNRAWRVTAAGLTSGTIVEHVRAQVSLRVSGARVGSQVRVTFSGSVSPAQRGEFVTIQRWQGGRWVAVVRLGLRRGSSFSDRRLMPNLGRERVRAVFGGDSRNIWSSSRTRTANL